MPQQYFSYIMAVSFIGGGNWRTRRAFNIFEVYQYFTIYRRYFILKFEQFS